MNATRKLHQLGQSLWLDDGTLDRYIGELCITRLTSNPTIFEKAIKQSRAYDTAIRAMRNQGKSAIYNLGGGPQRLLFASTGTKDPEASNVLYVRSLAAPFHQVMERASGRDRDQERGARRAR